MYAVKKIDGACFIREPKKILQLWLWPKHKALTYDENLKESLLLGKSSDKRGEKKCLKRVPKGFLAVYVGPEFRRFVIPMAYLSMPDFRVLMDSVAEEYGYEQEGALEIPCEEEEFEEILLRCLKMHQMELKNRKKR